MIKLEIEIQEPMWEMLKMLARLQCDYTMDEIGIPDVIDGLIEDGVFQRLTKFPAIIEIAKDFYGKETFETKAHTPE